MIETSKGITKRWFDLSSHFSLVRYAVAKGAGEHTWNREACKSIRKHGGNRMASDTC